MLKMFGKGCGQQSPEVTPGQPAPRPDQIADALASLLPLDYLYSPNVGQLQAVHANAEDPT